MILAKCEISALRPLNHPNSVRLIETIGVNEDGSIQGKDPVAILNFIEGETIMEFINKKVK